MSHALRIHLFGQFSVLGVNGRLPGLEARRVQELLAYLLLRCDHPQPREAVADAIWRDASAEQVRRGLRQTLWKLQTALRSMAPQLVDVDGDYVALEHNPYCWMDVKQFEDAYRTVIGVPGSEIGPDAEVALMTAVDLYRGDLLEGWYNQWCLEDRERLLSMFLSMLNKLTAHCITHARYDEGLEYGYRVLQHDRAHERAHRHLMCLYYMAGDRNGAVRQYHRCVDALREDLDVPPARRTTRLYGRILSDREIPAAGQPRRCRTEGVAGEGVDLAGLLTEIHDLRVGLASLDRQLRSRLRRSAREEPNGVHRVND